MNQTLRNGALVVWATLLLSACAPQSNVQGTDGDRQIAATTAGNSVTNSSVPINQRFRNLDEYLAHLERMNAPIDKPWYRQIRPGVYERQTGNFRPVDGEAAQRIFTREELEKKFGFSR